MTGRGIDQVLPHPVNPVLYEPYVRDAREYVQLAETANGPIPRPVAYAYMPIKTGRRRGSARQRRRVDHLARKTALSLIICSIVIVLIGVLLAIFLPWINARFGH